MYSIKKQFEEQRVESRLELENNYKYQIKFHRINNYIKWKWF